MNEQKNKMPEEELLDYLTQDLALAKLQLNENKRNSGKMLGLLFLLVFVIFACIGGFSATVFFITKEHTRQIESIFGARWELDKEKSHIYQDAGPSGNAIANINSHNINSSGTSNTINK